MFERLDRQRDLENAHEPHQLGGPRARRLVVLELLVVLAVTLGLSALRSALSLHDAALSAVPLAERR